LLIARPPDHTSAALGTLVAAAFSVINAIAVANIEPIPGAVLPDRVLDEPGKGSGKARIELPGVDAFGHGPD
jgi:predicted outer membrane lipoprotein